MSDEHAFKAASDHLQHLIGKSAKDADLLYLYARYKQATIGDCNATKPSFLNPSARSKWNAWNELLGMTKEIAMSQYVDRIRLLDPSCDLSSKSNANSGLGVAVSTMSCGEDCLQVPDSEKNIFDWCKGGSLEHVKQMLPSSTLVDSEKRTLLHWACDRGHRDIAEYLLKNGLNVNSQDINLSTPLHYAAACDYRDLVELLIQFKADPSIKDIDDETPLECATSKDVCELLKNVS